MKTIPPGALTSDASTSHSLYKDFDTEELDCYNNGSAFHTANNLTTDDPGYTGAATYEQDRFAGQTLHSVLLFNTLGRRASGGQGTANTQQGSWAGHYFMDDYS